MSEYSDMPRVTKDDTIDFVVQYDPPNAVDPMQMAIDELASEMVPQPEDILEECGPLACLWYTTQLAVFTVGRFTGTIDSDAGTDIGDDDGPVRALAALTTAAGNLYGACIAVGILDEDATWSE